MRHGARGSLFVRRRVALARRTRSATKRRGVALSAAGRVLVRWAVFTALWWVIAEGDVAALAVGASAALAAALISLALHPDPLPVVRPLGLARFTGFFLVHSVRGGIDVAVRALRPSMPIDPRIITYDLRLPGNTARVIFTNTLSLLPGTLSAKLGRDSLEVHVLDCAGDVTAEIARVEDRVAALFGVHLAPRSGGAC